MFPVDLPIKHGYAMYIQNKAEGQNVRILTEAQGNEVESMIREMRREEIPE